jgi:hypothetical protein
MIRGLLNLLTALSLLLCVAVVVLWVRSQWESDRVMRGSPWDTDTQVVVMSSDGVISVGLFQGFNRMVGWCWVTESAAPYDAYPWTVWGRLGFGSRWDAGPDQYGCRSRVIEFPTWLVAVSLSMLPLRFALGRPGRPKCGLCARCGYDLRATPGRCPECGVVSPTPRSPSPPVLPRCSS